MAEADPGALNTEQEEQLRAWRIQTRVSNEAYLRRHPEIRQLLSAFIREVLMRRPDNMREFAAEYFTDSGLSERIQGKMGLDGTELTEDFADDPTNGQPLRFL
ncbi:RIIa domain-containing protein 1 [Hyperolius riggenbachi]|uniref:RIIa domain-containing protein 1 n=1 Tax=Hyperolius riggenbachi TaxID=752182 RepID=UPI0035A2871D